MATARRIADTDSKDIGVIEPSRGVERHDGDPGLPPTGSTEVVPPDERWAEHLRSTVPALFMHASMIKPFPDAGPTAFRKYRNRVLADSGNPQDPVERMLLDQLALANFNVGLLQCRAANAPDVADAGVYAQAAARLMGEFRRSALALQVFRAASRQLAAIPKDDVVTAAPDFDPESNRSAPRTRTRKSGSMRGRSAGTWRIATCWRRSWRAWARWATEIGAPGSATDIQADVGRRAGPAPGPSRSRCGSRSDWSVARAMMSLRTREVNTPHEGA